MIGPGSATFLTFSTRSVILLGATQTKNHKSEIESINQRPNIADMLSPKAAANSLIVHPTITTNKICIPISVGSNGFPMVGNMPCKKVNEQMHAYIEIMGLNWLLIPKALLLILKLRMLSCSHILATKPHNRVVAPIQIAFEILAKSIIEPPRA